MVRETGCKEQASNTQVETVVGGDIPKAMLAINHLKELGFRSTMIVKKRWRTLRSPNPGDNGENMIRRKISDEAGARSWIDGSIVMFITAFTYIALTTNPVYTGIGVGDRVPSLEGQIYDGGTWTDFDLKTTLTRYGRRRWGTWFMIGSGY